MIKKEYKTNGKRNTYRVVYMNTLKLILFVALKLLIKNLFMYVHNHVKTNEKL